MVLLVYSDHIATYDIANMSCSGQCAEYMIQILVFAVEHAIESCLGKRTVLDAYLDTVAAFKVNTYVSQSTTI